MTTDHEQFMRVALQEAEAGRAAGNMAVGAVIVRDGQILVRGHNEANSTFDVTAHAETVAVRRLSTSLRVLNPGMKANSGPLAGCTLYTTVEPCPMCAWAICVGGISALVIGVRFSDMGVGYGEYAIEKLLALTAQRLPVTSGILKDECAAFRHGGQRP